MRARTPKRATRKWRFVESETPKTPKRAQTTKRAQTPKWCVIVEGGPFVEDAGARAPATVAPRISAPSARWPSWRSWSSRRPGCAPALEKGSCGGPHAYFFTAAVEVPTVTNRTT